MVWKFPKEGLKLLLMWLLPVVVILGTLPGAVAGKQPDYTGLFQSNRYLSHGHRGEEVKELQQLLSELGLYESGADGIFGDKTKAAVLEFQKRMNLVRDGIVGPGTRQTLHAEFMKLNPPLKHTVSTGETLWIIADKYGLSIPYLISINNLKNPDRIFPGDVLALRGDEKVTGAESGETPADAPVEVVLPPVEILPAPDKRICLTFNDGPDPTTTPGILAVLDEYGIKATFFVIGEKARKHPELVREIAEKGHVIGVHGYEHKALAGLTPREVQTGLQMAQTCVMQVSGQKPYLYRPPYGILDAIQVREAQKLGMAVLMWTNIGGADLGARSPQEVLERVLACARDGSIILLHEGLPHTAKALSEIISSLARMGFGFQNLSPGSVIGPVPGQ
ncbi:MAG TPA: polysaccharide deacetylase family protein [Firmicutes bacterium]|nr:polysaccharide deacetylase family protein [Candidatus Fermentithermobacillaceae bacterium]